MIDLTITKLDAYQCVAKYVNDPWRRKDSETYIRINENIWLRNEGLPRLDQYEVAAFEEAFKEINGIMHEQLPLL